MTKEEAKKHFKKLKINNDEPMQSRKKEIYFFKLSATTFRTPQTKI